jgi:hypothetical protein
MVAWSHSLEKLQGRASGSDSLEPQPGGNYRASLQGVIAWSHSLEKLQGRASGSDSLEPQPGGNYRVELQWVIAWSHTLKTLELATGALAVSFLRSILPQKFGEGGGSKIFVHTNHLSENNFYPPRHLHTPRVANHGRWVYEGGKQKSKDKK